MPIVETIDAAPLTFNFSNPSAGGTATHLNLHSYTPSYASSECDKNSITSGPMSPSMEHDFEDVEPFNHSYISHDDLKHYLDLLMDRKVLTIPPVSGKGLPPLELLNVHQPETQVVATKLTAHQLEVLQRETRRGPKYLLSFISAKLNFHPVPTASSGSNSASSSQSHSSSATSTYSGLHTSELDASLKDIIPQSPLRTKISTKNVFSRFRSKANLNRNSVKEQHPPSPVLSDHEPLDQDPFTSLTSPPLLPSIANGSPGSCNASLSPVSTFSSTHSAGLSSAPLLQPPQHQQQQQQRRGSSHQQRAPPIPGAGSNQLQPTLTQASSKTKSKNKLSQQKKKGKKNSNEFASVQLIKPSHKYMTNIGTLTIQGSRKQKFEVIIDPLFPVSFIDMDSIMDETTRAGHREFLTTSFHVVATPVYLPESKHNRVVIEVELIPMVNSSTDMGSHNIGYANRNEDRIPKSLQARKDDGFSLRWYNASKHVISLMDIRPQQCILGRDWLTHLSAVVG